MSCVEDIIKDNELTRKQAADSVPFTDCSGRIYDVNEREDLIRYVLWGAELQRDLIREDAGAS